MRERKKNTRIKDLSANSKIRTQDRLKLRTKYYVKRTVTKNRQHVNYQ